MDGRYSLRVASHTRTLRPDDLPPPHPVGLHSPFRSQTFRTGGSFCVSTMITTFTDIPADLITPLGAYLRLRDDAPASFLLESVEHGRLGQYSFVGSGS